MLWVGVALLLMSFGLLDTGIIVWSASLATAGQLAAFALAFASIGTGVLFTLWQMRAVVRQKR